MVRKWESSIQKDCRNCGDVFTVTNPRSVNCQKCIDVYGKDYLCRIWRDYAMTTVVLEDMYESQNGQCAICNRGLELYGDNKEDDACIDHCHSSGEVRGLLCRQCNRSLGQLGDTEEALMRAVNYLRGKNG